MLSSGGRANANLRGKRLHPQMAERVRSLYESEHYDEAVLAAFKVIEKRLRDITGEPDATVKKLLKDTLNVTTGILQDPKAWQSEREGIFNFFRSAFLVFRDRRAHDFVNTDAEEAFDLIVLANRMLLIVEERRRHAQPQPATPYTSYPWLYSLLSAVIPSVYGEERYGPKPVLLDADNDGEPELLIPSQLLTSNREEGEVFRVFKIRGETNQQIEVEKAAHGFLADEILLADVDNDGHQEVVCIARLGVGYNTDMLIYKYRGGRYEILMKDQHASTGFHNPHSFFRAHFGDIDDDGQVEVAEEPKLSGALPPPVRYVWRWNEDEGHFQFLYEEELTYDFPMEGRK